MDTKSLKKFEKVLGDNAGGREDRSWTQSGGFELEPGVHEDRMENENYQQQALPNDPNQWESMAPSSQQNVEATGRTRA